MTAILMVGGLVLLVFGAVAFVKPAWMWRWTQWRHEASGVVCGERSPAWERVNHVAGVVAATAGILMVVGGGMFWHSGLGEVRRKEALDSLSITCSPTSLTFRNTTDHDVAFSVRDVRAVGPSLNPESARYPGRGVLHFPTADGFARGSTAQTDFILAPGAQQQVDVLVPANTRCAGPLALARMGGCEAWEFLLSVRGSGVVDTWRRCRHGARR